MSAPLHAPFPAHEAVLSINVAAAEDPGCALGAWVSFQTVADAWSPWFTMLRWGSIDNEIGVTRDDGAAVDVDLLRLQTPADSWRYRIAWHDPSGAMFIRNAALNLATDPLTHSDNPGTTEVVEPALPVPFRSQWAIGEHPPERVCSPTALAMVALFHGIETTPESVAALAHDPVHDVYGNWSMNMLAASRLGLTAHVDRGGSLADLAASLQERQPVIASIAYGDGELPGAPVAASKGHLVVVAGIDQNGNVIVRDPAARGDDIWITYDRDAFARAWLGHGGVVYRIAAMERS